MIIKAVNSWDEEYTGPLEEHKLRGECAALYMEMQDIERQLKDVAYKQARARQIYTICVVVATLIVVIYLLLCGIDLFIFMSPISGADLIIGGVCLAIAVMIGGIPSIFFFSAMSVKPFWAQCANTLRIEKLEMIRYSHIRRKREVEERIEALEKQIENLTKRENTE